MLAAIGRGELRPLLWGSSHSSLSAGKEGRGGPSRSLPAPSCPGGIQHCRRWNPPHSQDGIWHPGSLSLGTGAGPAASCVGKCQWPRLAPALCCCSSAPLSSQAWGMSPLGPAGSQPGSPLPHHSNATAPSGCLAVHVALKLVAWASPVPESVGREVVAAAGPATILVRMLRGRS